MKYPIKRAKVMLEYYNEASLDKQLAELREKLLSGMHAGERTLTRSQMSLVLMYEQEYTENHTRERIVSFENGNKVELVKSRV